MDAGEDVVLYYLGKVMRRREEPMQNGEVGVTLKCQWMNGDEDHMVGSCLRRKKISGIDASLAPPPPSSPESSTENMLLPCRRSFVVDSLLFR
mmetsp:Transcript_17682/g.28245  ORF Transcript_17682/g.28245 Transcript_17682/m.28245 type:complete len:93 (+) Transcript_17682:2-280(+)